jgi:hypothetical protein
MGEVRESKGWRHFPLTERIDYLIEFLKDERVRSSYRRRMRTLLIFFIGTLAALWLAAAATIPAQLREGETQRVLVRASWLRSRGENLRAAFLEREFLQLTVNDQRDPYRLRAMRLHDVLDARLDPPRQRIARLTELSGLYLALYGPTPSIKTLCEALEIAENLRQLSTVIAAGDTFTGWRALGTAREMAEIMPTLLALLGDTLERAGHLAGARMAYRDALLSLPESHADRAPLRERIERLAPPPNR